VVDENGLPCSKYSGVDWIRRQIPYCKPKPKEPSIFGALVADILGAAFAGIYHLDNKNLMKTDWSHEDWIQFTMRRGHELATYDGAELSTLVILCHDARIRLSLDGHGMNYLRLGFHRRYEDGGGFHNRHWSTEEAVRAVRENLFDARSRAVRLTR